MPDTSVRYFNSAMSGAPSLSGAVGSLIGVLDACLVDGFGSVTVDSIVIASDVATATVSAGHQFAMMGNTGPVVTIANANPTALNGEWRITVIDTTTFTFATSGIPDQTATGTITAMRSPAGFDKAFSTTNEAAYRSDDIQGTRLYLYVDDTGTTNARIRGYESMSGIDTDLVGPFPTDAQLNGGFYVYKSSVATSDTRSWRLYADSRLFYFFCDSSANNQSWSGGMLFGDHQSYVPGDAYYTAISGSVAASNTYRFYTLSSAIYQYLSRNYTQVGGSITSARYSQAKSDSLGYGYQIYPAPADNKVHLWPIEFWDGTNNARGLIAGLWNPLHTSTISDGALLTDIPQLPNRTFLMQRTGSNYTAAMDLTGPWR